ncbi:hypothetical protein [uncultured Parabacteroides sp.]|uniref:hypothetical protein n=1 Tax=uncultured Parabacteroides sp. TaxID=512312 RepID=UPI0025946119|nr:hypothetical protein [uncultured Parabacteroides sp.]
MQKTFISRIPLLLATFLIACTSPDNQRLEQALQLAGDNRGELEKVLDHYADTPEKLAAARFLIMNMPGHTGVDSSGVENIRPVYGKHVAISEKHLWQRSSEWYKEIDSLWKNERFRVQSRLTPSRQDVRTVRAEQLIREIDRSFKAWKENAYTQNDSFEDFCRYVLPYRFAEGTYFDQARDTFYQRHASIFKDNTMDFRKVTDSLHRMYSDLMHNNWAAASMPIYNAASFEQVKRGSCDDKAWYNCLMMSALGMGVAIDFVPEWGNRAGGHSWNSLVVGGETYPFEPFWDDDRWKYKRIYNNECFDLLWGKFRLPKVYRRTFEHHFSGPLGNDAVSREDIPPLFKNPFMEDVSSQYFQTTDVKITITEHIPENTRYCYLCVFGAKEWQPVQWGKIEWNKKVTFKGMGRDIVYLPMFYQNGVLTPAASAFILTKDGNCEKLECKEEKMPVTVRNYTAYLYPEEIAEAKETLVGAYLTGCNDLNTLAVDTLYMMTDSMDTWENEINLPVSQKYRYIQLISPKDSLALCEISFYEQNKEDKPIQGVKVSADITPLGNGEELNMVTDSRSATGFRGRFNNPEDGKNTLWFDLGAPKSISRISYIPYTKNYLPKDIDIELWYWNNQWVKGGSLKGDYNFMTFENIPQGTIYRVKVKGTNDRIFAYKNGIIRWY